MSSLSGSELSILACQTPRIISINSPGARATGSSCDHLHALSVTIIGVFHARGNRMRVGDPVCGASRSSACSGAVWGFHHRLSLSQLACRSPNCLLAVSEPGFLSGCNSFALRLYACFATSRLEPTETPKSSNAFLTSCGMPAWYVLESGSASASLFMSLPVSWSSSSSSGCSHTSLWSILNLPSPCRPIRSQMAAVMSAVSSGPAGNSPFLIETPCGTAGARKFLSVMSMFSCIMLRKQAYLYLFLAGSPNIVYTGSSEPSANFMAWVGILTIWNDAYTPTICRLPLRELAFQAASQAF